MEFEKMQTGQIVLIVGSDGKHSGEAGQIRKINQEKKTAAVMVRGRIFTFKPEELEPEHA